MDVPVSRQSTVNSAESKPARAPFLLYLLLLVACWTVLSAPLQAGFCDPGHNLGDTDNDLLFDYACVGDWNNNGICEMEEDLQAAILSLNDPGPKTVLVDACNFVAPLAAQGLHGILELPDNITLRGFGADSLLNGFVETDLQSEQAVITNADHTGGNSNITIRDLRIDGGWRDGDASGFGHGRMGIRFTNCTDCKVLRVEVTDTLHACLYASNSTRVEFSDSTLARCGNYTGLGSHFPCVYLYAFQGGETLDALVRGNDCDGSGSSAMSTRRDAPSATLTNVMFRDNTIRNTAFYPTGAHRPCFRLSGVGSAQYLNNTCIDTGGLSSILTESYYSEGLDVNASANIIVDGLHVISSAVAPAVHVRKHAENFTLRNITVDGVTNGPCLGFEPPLRNFSLDGAELSNCGGVGILQTNSEPSGVAEDETLTFRNVEISAVGTDLPSEGLLFRGSMKGMLLDNVSVDGATADGLSFASAVEDSTISHLTISDVTGRGIYLGGNTKNVNLTYSDISNAGSDCIVLAGSPAPAVSHQQTLISESVLVNCAGRGIATVAGALTVQDLQISDNNIDGVDGDGIEIALADTQSENVKLEHNVLRDFGRSLNDGPHYGIELTGALSGTMLFQNTLHDWNDQAAHGIYHHVPGSHPTYLCSNPCIGTLRPTECLHEVEDPAYETDSDRDGTVDACEDDDDDGVHGPDDNCPDVSNPLQLDADQDGIGDRCDNCPVDYNPTQVDLDSDAEGDFCDLDDGTIYVRLEDHRLLHWQLEEGFSKWNAYRGDLAVLVAGGGYTQLAGSSPLADRRCGTSAPPWDDEFQPGAGEVAFYLVTGVTDNEESGLGYNSLGQPRANSAPCPRILFAGF